MKFGNAAWGFRETPLCEQFEITKEMGLDAIEIGIANAPGDIPLDVSETLIGNIKALSEEYGVKMVAGATGNDFTVGDADVEKVKKVIEISVLKKILIYFDLSTESSKMIYAFLRKCASLMKEP